MTRREEIEKTANEFYKGDEVSTFVVAAQWADKTMIEKAWDWFYNMALDYISGDITDVKWGSMKEDFFKAMEE